jgi:2'-5' RNA ligase
MRLFVALMFPEPAQTHFRELITRWRGVDALRGAKFAHEFHITLKFLGEVAPNDLNAVSDALDEALAGSNAFDVTAGGFGAFPHAGRASVLWQGVDKGAGALRDAARRTEDATAALGFERERRAFKAHVTMARFRQPVNLARWLITVEASPFPPFEASEYALVRSELRPNGAVYTVLRLYPLRSV